MQLAEGLDGDPIVIPTNDRLTALIGVLPLQLIAYELALLKGINPDTPRNLAKVCGYALTALCCTCIIGMKPFPPGRPSLTCERSMTGDRRRLSRSASDRRSCGRKVVQTNLQSVCLCHVVYVNSCFCRLFSGLSCSCSFVVRREAELVLSAALNNADRPKEHLTPSVAFVKKTEKVGNILFRMADSFDRLITYDLMLLQQVLSLSSKKYACSRGKNKRHKICLMLHTTAFSRRRAFVFV